MFVVIVLIQVHRQDSGPHAVNIGFDRILVDVPRNSWNRGVSEGRRGRPCVGLVEPDDALSVLARQCDRRARLY